MGDSDVERFKSIVFEIALMILFVFISVNVLSEKGYETSIIFWAIVIGLISFFIANRIGERFKRKMVERKRGNG